MSKKNIYTLGGTVNKGVYIERQADVDLLEHCRQGELAYILSSRQIGKSSLLVRTALQLEAENICTVQIDFNTIGVKVSRDEWYEGILSELQNQLDLNTDVFRWWESYGQLGPAQRLSKFFREVLLKEVKQQIVLFFDEIDSTLSLSFADDFYTAIRAVYNGRSTTPEFQRLSFVLVGVATPSDLIADEKRTPFNIGKRVELNDFSFGEALPLVAGLGEHAEQILERVFNFTGGHPYLTQLMCAHLANSKAALDENAVTRAFEQLFTGEQGQQDTNLQFVRNMLVKRSQNKRRMHLRRSRDRRQILLTYGKILAGEQVSDDMRSQPKAHLKLSGLVRSEKGNLQPRNEIYKRVFDLAWTKKYTEINWNLIIISMLVLIIFAVAFVGGFIIYKDNQYIAEQPGKDTECFYRNSRAESRLACLADLFHPKTILISGNNSLLAIQLFFGQSSWYQQVSIFQAQNANPRDTEVVVNGLYTNLADVESSEQNTKLLWAMLDALQSANLDSNMLETEIQHWIQAREKLRNSDYLTALQNYSQAIDLNPNNPATLFERARVYTQLGNYEAALNDYEQVIEISPKSENDLTERSTQTPTSSATSTATRILTLTPTRTSILTPTSTPYGGYLGNSISNPTITATSASLRTPTATPYVEPSVTPTVLPDDTPVKSSFSGLFDRIDAVRNDINQNQGLYSTLARANATDYANLKDWGIIPVTLTATSTALSNQVATMTPSLQPISSRQLYYMLVYDASASMEESFHGQQKWQVARNLVIELMSVLPSNANFGLVTVGGSNLPNGSGGSNLCNRPSEVTLPFSSRDVLNDYLNGLRPAGGGSFYQAYLLAKNELESLPEDSILTMIYITGSSDSCETEDEWAAIENLLSLPDSRFRLYSQIIILDEDGIKAQTLADQINSLNNENVQAEAPESISGIRNAVATSLSSALTTPLSCPPASHPFLAGPGYGGSVSISSPDHCSIGLRPESPILAAGSYSDLPQGTVLWELVYAANGLYYPQSPNACAGSPPPEQSSGIWSVNTYLGSIGESPTWYDIVVVLADQTASNFLSAWLSGNCPDFQGIEPALLSGLNITEKAYVTVQTNGSLPQPSTNIPDTPPGRRECNDGVDNDGDGQIDYPNDADCSNRADDSEG